MNETPTEVATSTMPSCVEPPPTPRPVERTWRFRHCGLAALVATLVAGAAILAACQPNGSVLRGRLTDTTAGHLPGVAVRVYAAAADTLIASTTTDTAGDWSFMPTDLPDGTYRVRFSDDAWWQDADAWSTATDVTVTAGSPVTLDATIDAAKGSVAGTVTGDGAPLARATVTADDTTSGHVMGSTTTGDDGTYTLAALVPGTYHIEFSHAGYATRYSDDATSAGTAPTVTVTAGTTTTGIDTSLVAESTVTGTILDGATAAPGALVALFDPAAGDWVELATTDATGHFALTGVNTGAYTVAFLTDGAASATVYGTTSTDPADGASIDVPASTNVDLGTLVSGTATYAPLAPRNVSATPGDGEATVSWSPPASTGGGPVTGYTVTADPGGATCSVNDGTSCKVTGLTDGTAYTFTVTATNATGTGPASAPSAAVTPEVVPQWQQFVPSPYTAPNQREMTAMTGLSDGTALLFGGSDPANSVSVDDTWIFHGTTWTQLHPATSPPARMGASLTALPDGKALLFGGTPQVGDDSLGDTWIWTGTDWTQLHPTTSPPARYGAAMTTMANGDVVLFGGDTSGANMVSDTWIFDGTTWTRLHPATSPSARLMPSLAGLDDATALLFGGMTATGTDLADTWSFDGTNWTQLHPAAAPPARLSPVLAATGGSDALLFGGATGQPGTALADTWAWNGTTWTHLDPATAPTARFSAGGATTSGGDVVVFAGLSDPSTMAANDTWVFDGTDWTRYGAAETPDGLLAPAMTTLANGDILAFGGGDTTDTEASNDTWLFDGTGWKQLHPAISPPGRAFASMTTLANGDVVLFGGTATPSPASELDDTWIFDGTDWTQASPTTSPPATAYAAMATGPNGNAVLYGGQVFTGDDVTISDQTWIFDGTDWTRAHPTTTPPTLWLPSMTTLPTGDIVLFGGFSDAAANATDQTWIFDGTNWTQAHPTTTPPARGGQAMAPVRGGAVIFGGATSGLASDIDDTWIFDGTDWTEVPGADPPAAMYGAMATMGDGTVVFFGGEDFQSGLPSTDTWILTP